MIAGKPLVVTVNVPGVPTVNVVVLALVNAGAWFTVSVKACGARRADAVGRGEGEGVGAAGTRSRRAAQRARAVAVVDEGHASRQRHAADASIVGSGKPLVVTVNVPAAPTMKVVLAALVMAGASVTFSVKACVPFGRTPFAAVNVRA